MTVAINLHFLSQAKVNYSFPNSPFSTTNTSATPSPNKIENPPNTSAANPATQEENEKFQQIIENATAQQLHHKSMPDIIQAIANQFIGTPYQAGLLDKSKAETLVVTLNKFDCVLFVETVLAMARGIAMQDYSYEAFRDRIIEQRYENGELNGYCSRLHYLSGWIDDNQKRGIVENITVTLGGVPLNKQLNFMSTHRQSYPQLVDSEGNYQCILEMEAKLNHLTINYIPTSGIPQIYDRLQPGDIIGVATDIPGLDVTHTGLVYRQIDGNIGLIHASPAGSVRVARDLQQYVGNVKHSVGIIVTRPIDSRI
ncbi:N-acetylmuramoyl-L-alanine amidase-like domain-containing protein [Limnofasciculus baicalensis]|nr:N-acetylmuramoyl-L-alanine amidase-like domain-containing protein [Limnofasciculus baicalensis]